MRKIKILKALVDFLWITTLLGLVLLLVLAILALIMPNSISENFQLNGLGTSKLSSFQITIEVLLSSFNLLLIYCFYLFRKIVHSFDNLDLFNANVSINFTKIGKLLVFVGLINIFRKVIHNLFFNVFKLSFGFNWNIIGLIALGLFCIVLSEVFKISRQLKQENDLTI